MTDSAFQFSKYLWPCTQARETLPWAKDMFLPNDRKGEEPRNQNRLRMEEREREKDKEGLRDVERKKRKRERKWGREEGREGGRKGGRKGGKEEGYDQINISWCTWPWISTLCLWSSVRSFASYKINHHQVVVSWCRILSSVAGGEIRRTQGCRKRDWEQLPQLYLHSGMGTHTVLVSPLSIHSFHGHCFSTSVPALLGILGKRSVFWFSACPGIAEGTDRLCLVPPHTPSPCEPWYQKKWLKTLNGGAPW